MQRTRRRLGVLAIGIAFVSSGCLLNVQPSGPAVPWTHDDTWRAIDRLVPAGDRAKARCTVGHESGGYPYAKNGIFEGPWQIDSTNEGYEGSGAAATETLNDAGIEAPHSNTFFDPWVATQTAVIIMASRRAKGLDPWWPWQGANGC